MNKILKFLRRKLICVNEGSDREMVSVCQVSPRITRSKSKNSEKVDVNIQQKETEDGKRKGSGRRGRSSATDVTSVMATRGSVGSVSLLHTPEGLLHKGLLSPKIELSLPLPAKSPPIGTISADTPERTSHFRRQIENAAESSLRILGKGSFGTIIQATYKGELVAAKIVPPHKTNTLKNELNNFLLLHPNIVRTLRIISNEESNSCGLVIMEMCSSVTLEHLFNEESYQLDDLTIARIMTDVGNALNYCHHQRVLHLDFKPLNILVNVSTNACKLCDFGSSCLVMEEDTAADNSDYKALQSTVVYTSPELLTGGIPTDKSDVYSFGITLWQLVHREKPYVVDNKIDLQATIYKVVTQKKRPQGKTQKNGPLSKLYTRCWNHEPDNRPTMSKVLEYINYNYLV